MPPHEPFEVDPDLPPEERVAWLLRRLDHCRRLVEQRRALGVADGRLLWVLSDGRARTLRELADALQLEQSTVNRQVNSALTAGLLSRFTEPGRSAGLIEPTEQGRTAMKAASAFTFGTYVAGLAPLGDKADEFVDLLDQFSAAYAETVRDTPKGAGAP